MSLWPSQSRTAMTGSLPMEVRTNRMLQRVRMTQLFGESGRFSILAHESEHHQTICGHLKFDLSFVIELGKKTSHISQAHLFR
jgi:hypothetical protein